MTEFPAPLLMLGAGLALTALVLLWKVLLTATAIGLIQWAVVANLAEHPGIVFAAFALPALLAALALRRGLPSARPVPHRLAMAGSSHARRREHLS